jgi:predicted phosphoribosyltransferase
VRLGEYADRDDVIVLGLPRGGVPVAAEVADALGAQLDVLVVRKIGVPVQPELAMGAIASVAGHVETVRNEQLLDELHRLGVDGRAFEDVARHELLELRRRESAYRSGADAVDLAGQTVLLVDDGLATGATMRAAVMAARGPGPARLIVAVPVAAQSACEGLHDLVDEVVCLATPEPFGAVGGWYVDFDPTSDDEVRKILAAAGGS